MRSSPSLPPSGYTRALPRPPRSRLPWTATAVATGTAAVAVAAVLALPGDRPPRSLTAGGGPTTGVAG
ncbi:hypothetical protein, partial [Actinomadura kijaniata]|uniref:hypothetical protein n=1 Tax=Actinomadura kijaniata TaxID=46161 RepID=UPI0012FC0A81